MSSFSNIKSFLDRQKTKENFPILVHSDIVRARHLIKVNVDISLMLSQHIFLLEELTSGDNYTSLHLTTTLQKQVSTTPKMIFRR